MSPKDCSPCSSPRALGRIGEELAAAHLVRRDFTIVARNVRTRHGEIDLIAHSDAALVFVEVKTRRASAGAPLAIEPLAGLRTQQRARLRRLAAAWLSESGAKRPTARAIRFDAIGVTLDARDRLMRLDHLEDAW